MSERASEAQLARVAVVGGRGAVGRLFAGTLADAGCAVLAVDRAPAPAGGPEPLAAARAPAGGPGGRCDHVVLDAEQPSAALREALGGADAVVLALPEAAALNALPHVLGALAPGALLADTLSVKTPFARAVQAADAPVEALSLNPMFAPALGFAGRPVLAIELAPGPRTRVLIALLEARGARIVRVGAERHDALTAALQVAPHAALLALGLALAQLDVELDMLLALAPPPFLTLLALLARIASASPETYWDIQDANPHAADARAALQAALGQLDTAALGHDAAAFERLLEQVAALLGDRREPLAELAATLLEHARPAGPS